MKLLGLILLPLTVCVLLLLFCASWLMEVQSERAARR